MRRSHLPFTAAVLAGVLIDLALHLPAVFQPAEALARLGQAPAASPDLRWVAFASWLAVLVAAFYLPGGLAPYRYRLGAWLAVWGRAACAAFFLLLYRDHTALGWLNLGLFVVLLPLLVVALRARPRPDVA